MGGGEEVGFGGGEGGAEVGGVGGKADLFKKIGGVSKQAKAGEDMKVEAVVGATNEKEDVGGGAFVRAEENWAERAADAKEGFGEEVRVVKARVKERGTTADGSGGGFFAGGEFGEEEFGVVNEGSGFGEVGHIADDTGLSFGGEEGEGEGVVGDEGRDAEIVAISAASFAHCGAVLGGELSGREVEHAALGPLIKGAVLK